MTLIRGVRRNCDAVRALPLQLLGLFGGARAWSSPVTWFVWLPLLGFEVTLAIWLLTKGVAATSTVNA